jgi:molybdopterin-guanine dinucleotide biosynthesis protein A
MTVGAVVLAGGRSTRMGRPKAGLDWHGVPLVVHVARELQQALDGGPVVVVAAPGQALADLPPGVPRVDDPAEGRGPLQGVAAGLAALEAEAAVVAGTDQPFVARVVPLLRDAAGPDTDAVAIRLEGRLQPLGALYRTALHGTAQARLDAGDGSLQGLLRAVRTAVVDAPPGAAEALRSLDTPEAYAAALALRS